MQSQNVNNFDYNLNLKLQEKNVSATLNNIIILFPNFYYLHTSYYPVPNSKYVIFSLV